jgi:hypothetical protein
MTGIERGGSDNLDGKPLSVRRFWHGSREVVLHRPLARFHLRIPTAALAACVISVAHAQTIEPRTYSNLPVDANFLLGGFASTLGRVSFDPSLPITDPKLTTSSAVLAYARALDLWGKSGKFDVVVPYT